MAHPQVIGRRIIGAREFSRYYRQRPRPVDTQAVAVAAAGVRRAPSTRLRVLMAWAHGAYSSLQGAGAGACQSGKHAELSRTSCHSPGATREAYHRRRRSRTELSLQQARVQRVEHRTTARLRMITEMNANGPQFRGFRE
jgi:hypothetical protein